MFRDGRNILLAGLAAASATACSEAPHQADRVLRVEIASACKPGQTGADGRMIADELRGIRLIAHRMPGGYGPGSELVQGLADSYRDCTGGDFDEARSIQILESPGTRYVDHAVLEDVRDAVSAGLGRSYREIDLDERRED